MENCILFVGSYNAIGDNCSAASAAGNQVQQEIVDQLTVLSERDELELASILMKPIRTWPLDSLVWPGQFAANIYMPPFINIFGFRRLIFSLFLFIETIRRRPKLVVKYNASALEVIALLLFRLLFPAAYLVAIIQDVNISTDKKFRVGGLLELFAMRLVRRFNYLIPISDDIASDFSFDSDKTRVFNGGLTRQGRNLLAADEGSIEQYAVYAGALTPYNGIELLVKRWSAERIDLKLHIFGKGVSEEFVRKECMINSNIIFHGFQSEAEVSEWQKSALINFCLRYSDGIDAGYFFPSKFFNVICAPGFVMVNDFRGFPNALKGSCVLLEDDLSDLSAKIDDAKSSANISELRQLRRGWITENGDWGLIVRHIFERALDRAFR